MSNKKEKPDLVVWDEINGYNARMISYPTNIGAPSFDLPNVGLIRTESSKKMIDVFNREKQEILQKIENLQKEYIDSIMVWESKISFEPIIGHTYHLYNFDGDRHKVAKVINPDYLIYGEKHNIGDSH